MVKMENLIHSVWSTTCSNHIKKIVAKDVLNTDLCKFKQSELKHMIFDRESHKIRLPAIGLFLIFCSSTGASFQNSVSIS